MVSNKQKKLEEITLPLESHRRKEQDQDTEQGSSTNGTEYGYADHVLYQNVTDPENSSPAVVPLHIYIIVGQFTENFCLPVCTQVSFVISLPIFILVQVEGSERFFSTGIEILNPFKQSFKDDLHFS
jgi:hypothetical protein